MEIKYDDDDDDDATTVAPSIQISAVEVNAAHAQYVVWRRKPS